jgi:bifunctional DNA-binding transcriptional regulator/antitoxin component of YhaV-PrlF toxin-antitoxin module
MPFTKARIVQAEENENGEIVITIPEDIIESLGWKPGDKVDVDAHFGRIYVKKIEDQSQGAQ